MGRKREIESSDDGNLVVIDGANRMEAIKIAEEIR